jgi:hypothetical protein
VEQLKAFRFSDAVVQAEHGGSPRRAAEFVKGAVSPIVKALEPDKPNSQ